MTISKTPNRLVVIAGQFPPPVHGLSYITQQIAKAVAARYETATIDLAPHVVRSGTKYHLERLRLTYKGIWTLFENVFRRNRIFYMASDSRLGLIYNIHLGAAARLLRYPIFIHYHNFNFIDRYSALMRVLLSAVGKSAKHIFLCPLMAKRFSERYGLKLESLVLSNSIFVEQTQQHIRERSPTEPLIMGLLSNLNDEKGLSLFIELLERCLADGINIKGILAGPPVSPKDAQKIAKAKQRLGDKLDYHGPIYGYQKRDFFKMLDVFVFPTTYANEAQPTVIFEAMANGIPVISYERGSIKGQVGAAGMVVEQTADFVARAMPTLKQLSLDPVQLRNLKSLARLRFIEDRSNAEKNLERLFDLPV